MTEGADTVGYSRYMSKLFPEVVVDKNGRATTVYKKEDENRSGFKGFLGSIAPGSGPSRGKLVNAIRHEINELNSHSPVRRFFKFTSPIRTENLEGLLAVLKDEKTTIETVQVISDRLDQLEKENFNEWLVSFTQNVTEMRGWPCGHRTGPDDGMIAKLMAETLHLRDKGHGLSPEEEMSLARLTVAVLGTGLNGELRHRATKYGMAFFSDNAYLRDFAGRFHDDPEIMETATALIAGNKVNRLEDLESVVSGEIPTVFVEGAL
jgi:hypothetical protein